MIQLNIKEGKNAIKVVERLLLWGEAYKEKHGNDPFDKEMNSILCDLLRKLEATEGSDESNRKLN
ncbi:MAG: hypothetical protein PUG38_03000 [Sutterellaceae bacterium]|nr:hypothetical protein [Sutterellaceae bacterium]MDY2868466.1 hypothetical protein [Mesosutterella sp.]